MWGVDRVSILCIRGCVCWHTCWFRLTFRWVGWEAYVEGTGVFHVGWCREKFCQDIAGVFGRFNSSDLHFALDVVLSDSVVADIDAPTMFIHSRFRCDVFGSLVVGEEVRCRCLVAIEF